MKSVLGILILVTSFAIIANGQVERIELHAAAPKAVISPLLFDHNLEVTRRAIWSGLCAEMVANRKFAANENGMDKRWSVTGSVVTVVLDDQTIYVGKIALQVNIAAQDPSGITRQQETLCFRKNVLYQFLWWLKTEADRSVRMRLTDVHGATTLFEAEQSLKTDDWQLWSGEFAAAADASNARLEFTSKDPGNFWVGAVSVQPADAFHSIRRDVIEAFRQIKPASLRFPGGCMPSSTFGRMDCCLLTNAHRSARPAGFPAAKF